MFNIGDRVLHQATGCSGTVVGYSHRILEDGAYLPTLNVLVMASDSHHLGFIEDLTSRWVATDAANLVNAQRRGPGL